MVDLPQDTINSFFIYSMRSAINQVLKNDLTQAPKSVPALLSVQMLFVMCFCD